VQLVISDAHEGLKQAVGAVFAGAAWQRCRAHFLRDVLTRVPRGNAEMGPRKREMPPSAPSSPSPTPNTSAPSSR
jgi:transposase-like protein